MIKNETLQQFGVRANGIHQEDFLEVGISNRFMKWALTGSFGRASRLHFHSVLAFYQVWKNEMLKQIGIITNEIYQKGFLKVVL